MLRKFNFSTKSILTLSLITLSLLSFLFYNLFMLRDGQVINSYLGDMNDRSKTEKYMREFATHLSNPIPVD
jgi:predicted PurR-regulated permease PerM